MEIPQNVRENIENANNVCFDCGRVYWELKPRPIWVWEAKCDICWKDTMCAAPRDFNYFKQKNETRTPLSEGDWL